MSLLDLNTSATTRLGLEPIRHSDGKNWLFNGCVPTQVLSVTKTYQKHEKGEFAGLEVPVLAIEFTNLKFNPNDPDKYLTHQIKPIGSKELAEGTTDVYVNRELDKIKADTIETWKQVKHFLESLTGSPNYKPITSISKEDSIKYLNLPEVGEPKERLAAYDNFFDFIVKFVNGADEKHSQIVDANGNPLALWIKVLPNWDKNISRRSKYYTIPRFVGGGLFEPLKIDATTKIPISPKIIRVRPSEPLELVAATNPAQATQQNVSKPPMDNAAMPDDVAEILYGKRK